MQVLPIVHLVSRLEGAAALDPWVGRVKSAVDSLIRPQSFRDVLHGVPIGHPVHPVGVQVPLGAWLSAAVLDTAPGNERAASLLVGIGVLSAAPSAVTGFTDWSELHEQQQRVGIVHAAGNAVAAGLYLASWIARLRGRTTAGKALGYVGLGVVSVAGFLGGHLAYRQAAGVNHTEDLPHRFPAGWQALGPLEAIAEGRAERRMLAGLPLLVFRRGAKINVLADVCSHLSGPLHEGEITDGADPCVICPWHGSEFSLRSGEVVHGPATAPQPRFDTRIVGGVVEVSLPGAG